MSGWRWVRICSMLDNCCLLLTAFCFLMLLLLSVGRWIPYFWILWFLWLLWLRVREFEFKNFVFRVENE